MVGPIPGGPGGRVARGPGGRVARGAGQPLPAASAADSPEAGPYHSAGPRPAPAAEHTDQFTAFKLYLTLQ